MIDHEQLKNLPLMDEQQQHKIFNSLMNQINNVSDSEFLNCMQGLSIYFIKFISPNEMKFVTECLVKYILGKGTYINQIVELCGFYIKFFDRSCQARLFDAVMRISDSLSQHIKGITALAKFIRESGKILSDDQLKSCLDLLEKLSAAVPPYLHDTIEYTTENIKNNFIPSKADVLLLIPEFLTGSSFLQPPICMMQAKSDLVTKGFKVDLMDNRVYHYSIADLVKMVANNYKYIVVTSSPIDQYQAYFVDKRFVIFSEVVNAIQKGCNYEKLIVCGSHGTVDYKLLLNDVSPDIILLGSYESKLGCLIANLEHGTTLNDINGIVFKSNDKYIKNCAKSLPKIIDQGNSYIDYSQINLDDYYGYSYIDNIHVIKKKWAILQTTVGCPYDCIFCYNIYGKKVRFKSISNVIKEIKQLEKQGCKEIFFIDQTFTINQEYTKELCESIISNNIKIHWQCETRVDLLKESTLSLMKKAGCTSIWIGIESFDDTILSKNKKGYTTTQLINLLCLLKDKEINYSAFIMFGMYGETVKSLNTTIDTILKNKIKTSKSFIQCIPRPGTELYMKLDRSLRGSISHFWQVDSLRNKFNDDLTQKDINLALDKLINCTY